jgi:hypothetical protein
MINKNDLTTTVIRFITGNIVLNYLTTEMKINAFRFKKCDWRIETPNVDLIMYLN